MLGCIRGVGARRDQNDGEDDGTMRYFCTHGNRNPQKIDKIAYLGL